MSSKNTVQDLLSSGWLLGTLALGAVGLVVHLWLNHKKKPNKWHTTVPGLEPSHPDLGNVPDFAKAGSVAQFLSSLHKRYGPIASFWWERKLAVSLASPALFKQVAKLFNRPVEPWRPFLTLQTEHCLCCVAEEDARRRHTAYSRCFSDGPLKNFYDIFHKFSEELSSKWMSAPAEKWDIEEEMFHLSIRCFTKASFGRFFDDEREIDHLYNNYNILWNELDRQAIVGPPEPGSEQDQHFQKIIEVVHAVMKKAIKHHDESGGSGDGNLAVFDVIKEVTKNEAERLGDALNIFFAGFHTTAMLLTWSLYFLAKHPQYQEKVFQELCDVLGDGDVDDDNIQDLVYTRQVLDEALRLSTLVVYTARHSDEECIVDGHVLPPKTIIIMDLAVCMEEDETLWPGVGRFNPDHFSPERRKQLPVHAFEPFGFAGKRKCPGYKFAQMEATTVLTVLLRKFKMKLVNDTEGYIEKIYSVVPNLKEKLFLTAEKRPPNKK